MSSVVRCDWIGPFSWHGRGPYPDLVSPTAQVAGGIYIWCVPVGDTLRVNYIGKAEGNLPARIEHSYKCSMAGMDQEFVDPDSFEKGIRKVNWARRKAPYPKWGVEERSAIQRTYQCMVYFLAPLKLDDVSRLVQVESTLIRRCRSFDAVAGRFRSNNKLSRRDLGEIAIVSRLPASCGFSCPAVPCGVTILESGEIAPQQVAATTGSSIADSELLCRIEIDAAIMAGQPVIRGTRLTVRFILNVMAHGMAADELLSEYDGITLEDIRACLLFASTSAGIATNL
ncbi:MAG TPA: DUF433 domain-containing protein [Caulifigura sp.]|nr:DUF433 domain-containing protein [Caulifigura sp.]